MSRSGIPPRHSEVFGPPVRETTHDRANDGDFCVERPFTGRFDANPGVSLSEETGLDQDTAYSLMDGRHTQAQKAMSRLQEEVLKQEQALKTDRVNPKATRQDSSVKEKMS
jgi:hypothetical protein